MSLLVTVFLVLIGVSGAVCGFAFHAAQTAPFDERDRAITIAFVAFIAQVFFAGGVVGSLLA